MPFLRDAQRKDLGALEGQEVVPVQVGESADANQDGESDYSLPVGHQCSPGQDQRDPVDRVVDEQDPGERVAYAETAGTSPDRSFALPGEPPGGVVLHAGSVHDRQNRQANESSAIGEGGCAERRDYPDQRGQTQEHCETVVPCPC